jgi:ADP-dependent NAD(P)H-hydrate dehydratase / NAD(P)H-hydrate epimerase
VKIVSVEQMRALEAAAFARGISEAALQATAGRAVADVLSGYLGPDRRLAVLIGPGNNGRDAAIAGRHLAEAGTPVELLLSPRHAVTSDELDQLARLGAQARPVTDAGQLDEPLRRADVALDGLTGIGSHGPLREPLASFAARLNQVRADRRGALTVIAVDVPSGIDADSGAVPGTAVAAHVTVTLGAVKQGLLLFPAAERVGRLVARPIGIPPDALGALPFDQLDAADVAELVPPRPLDAHKYRLGRVLAVAGSHHYLGAPMLCAVAAARAGAGMVTVASSGQVRQALATRAPEITYAPDDVEPERDPDGSLAVLEPLLGGSRALVIGPGLGRAEGTIHFVRRLLEARAGAAPDTPAVVDADALYALADWVGWPARVGPNVVLTPHSGELARLAGEPPPAETPWARAAQLSARWGVVLVAKGPFTSVAEPGGRVAVWPHANPALASAGTGDVLAGLIAGLLAQGADAYAAARLGVVVHALAAEAVQAREGWRSLLASDLLPELPRVLARLSGADRPRPYPRGTAGATRCR